MVLRQHYLTGGENLINEWSIQFLANKEAEVSEGKAASSALQVIRNIFDPASQVREKTCLLSTQNQPAASSISLPKLMCLK